MFISGLGFQQFLTQDSEMTQELVEEGKEHMKRERRRRQRLADAASRRKEFSDRFGPSENIDMSGKFLCYPDQSYFRGNKEIVHYEFRS